MSEQEEFITTGADYPARVLAFLDILGFAGRVEAIGSDHGKFREARDLLTQVQQRTRRR